MKHLGAKTDALSKRHSSSSLSLAPLDCSRTAKKSNKPLGKSLGSRRSLDSNIDDLLNTHANTRRGGHSFEEAARQFNELQAQYKSTMKKAPCLDIKAGTKGALKPLVNKLAATTPLAQLPAQDFAAHKFGSTCGSKFSVLPGISEKAHKPAESPGGAKDMEQVEGMMPSEYLELKQMMALHEDLKGQMASNRQKLTELKQAEGEDNGVLKLLREQATHVVAMMKDVLSRLETYPEELWALYGTVEAYEASLTDNAAAGSRAELYSQILYHVQAFLELGAVAH